MITKSVLYDVILDPYTIALNFSVGGLHIKGTDYARLVSPICDGKLQIVQGNHDSMCFYSPERNTLYTSRNMTGNNWIERALLLHELTHAVADYKGKKMFAFAGETSGYIVQCGFQIAKGLTTFRSDGSPAGAMWTQAYKLAHKHGLAKHGGKGCHIKTTEWRSLGSLINLIEGYKHLNAKTAYNADGIAA